MQESWGKTFSTALKLFYFSLLILYEKIQMYPHVFKEISLIWESAYISITKGFQDLQRMVW